MKYNLRTKEELQEETKKILKKKKAIEDYFKSEIINIESDLNVIKLEMQLLQSIGKA